MARNDMDEATKIYYKTPRDAISTGFLGVPYPEWEPSVTAIRGDSCTEYMNKLKWLEENPIVPFRIENGEEESNINCFWQPSNPVRRANGEKPENDNLYQYSRNSSAYSIKPPKIDIKYKF